MERHCPRQGLMHGAGVHTVGLLRAAGSFFPTGVF
jgi:hypothetical protein